MLFDLMGLDLRLGVWSSLIYGEKDGCYNYYLFYKTNRVASWFWKAVLETRYSRYVSSGRETIHHLKKLLSFVWLHCFSSGIFHICAPPYNLQKNTYSTSHLMKTWQYSWVLRVLVHLLVECVVLSPETSSIRNHTNYLSE